MTPEQRIAQLENEIQIIRCQIGFTDTPCYHGGMLKRLRDVEKQVDTLWTPPWKKLWFVIDGWPLYRVVPKRQWRPWH